MTRDGTPPTSRRSGRTEDISCNAWDGVVPLERVLLIRLHATGDVAITLPACVALRTSLPDARIEYLTSPAGEGLAGALTIFDAVHRLPDSRTRWKRGIETIRSGLALTKLQYDLVIDLQRNWVTRAIRRMCLPQFWSEFDRFSPLLAGERVRQSFIEVGFPDFTPEYTMPVREELLAGARNRLQSLGWDGLRPLVCLNPGGLWKTRNWPLEHYVGLATALLRHRETTFVLLGDGRIAEPAKALTASIPGPVINLASQTTLAEAFAIVQELSLIVSDDSGLMHMAWNSGIPTIALFGSTRHDWSAPTGSHTRTFHSGDLACGACMSPECAFGDVHCLTRYTPERLLDDALELLGNDPRRRTLGGISGA